MAEMDELIPWAVIEKFANSASELAAVESQIAMMHERRVKCAHQLRSAVQRRDKTEAQKAYFAWLSAWDKIQSLHGELGAISRREANRFEPDEGMEAGDGNGEVGVRSGRESGDWDPVAGFGTSGSAKPLS